MTRTPRRAARSSVIVRPARAGDAAALSALTGQLGYDVSTREISAMLRKIARHKWNAAFIAQNIRSEVVGWIQLFDEIGLAGGHRVEIAGLVVEVSCRGTGVGRQLMEFAERWARKRGCRYVYLRTNVTRAAAHIFYERLGYSHIKTQKAYRKPL